MNEEEELKKFLLANHKAIVSKILDAGFKELVKMPEGDARRRFVDRLMYLCGCSLHSKDEETDYEHPHFDSGNK